MGIGFWLQEEKKTANNTHPNATKNVTQNKSNRFSLLTNMAYNKFPPRPSPHDVTRTNKNPCEAKKRRHDCFNDDTIITSLDINPKPQSHGPTQKINKVFKPVLTPVKATPSVTPIGPTISSQTKNSQAPPHTSPSNNNTPTQIINYKIATSQTSTLQIIEKNRINNNQFNLENLDDETMIRHDNIETIQVNLTEIDRHPETSSDCKEDMVT